MVMIGESQSFSMQANVMMPGFQRTVLTGYVVSKRPDGTYIAPLLPQMFLGASGTQLTSWRQYLSTTGSQTILTKPAGDLLVPREELYWRKIAEPTAPAKVEAVPIKVEAEAVRFDLKNLLWIVPVVAVAGFLLYTGLKDQYS